jgi:hypothetical protein
LGLPARLYAYPHLRNHVDLYQGDLREMLADDSRQFFR